MSLLREALEQQQVTIYFVAVALGALVALTVPGTSALELAINPVLALMLFVTFLQVPLADLGKAFANLRFTGALLVANFVFVPLVALCLVQFLPADPLVRLGVLLVLLTPCIDYVVTFSHLGRGDARLLLAATPTLLIVQMLLLPVYLGLFLDREAARLVQLGPFVHAFVWLIAAPLVFAALVQWWAARSSKGQRTASALGLFPVPATALVLFVVIAAVLPQLGPATDAAVRVIPIYAAFAVITPAIGWAVGRFFRLEAAASRSVAFSSATRNSLVVLPLALAVPGAIPVVPAIIVTQTLIELVSELIYVRVMPKLGSGSLQSQG